MRQSLSTRRLTFSNASQQTAVLWVRQAGLVRPGCNDAPTATTNAPQGVREARTRQLGEGDGRAQGCSKGFAHVIVCTREAFTQELLQHLAKQLGAFLALH